MANFLLLIFFPLLLALPLPANAKPQQGQAVAKPAATLTSTRKPKTGRININTADVELLTFLHGIGEKKAQAIVDYRNEHGPFKNIQQLDQVKGIGPATIERNKGLIVLK